MSESMSGNQLGDRISPEPRRSRLALELSDAAVDELEALQKITGMSKGDLGRLALIAVGILIRAKQRGEEVQLVNPAAPDRPRILELPISIARDSSATRNP